MTDNDPPEELSPAGERLRGLLHLLDAERPHDGESLTHAVIRAAQWQRIVRDVVRGVAELGLAAAGGLRVLLRSEEQTRR